MTVSAPNRLRSYNVGDVVVCVDKYWDEGPIGKVEPLENLAKYKRNLGYAVVSSKERKYKE